MKNRILTVMFALVLAIGVAGGCSKSDDSDSAEASKFVGRWHMSLNSDASDAGFDWRFNADETSIVLYNTGSTNAKGSGTCAISGDSASGTWSAGGENKGRFTATLTGDNAMDFNFIEDKYSPAKTFVYTGARKE